MKSDQIRRIINPLAGIPREELFDQVNRFVREKGLEDKEDIFRKGALVAQSPSDYEDIKDLTDDDKYHLRREKTRKY